ncbi:uncharacterized protein LOC120638474 [Ornithorhynchus anatinus]|uniref:uncharacterized protein LOC120638474 n=1 Tax=Ornithorhynchus anatinus TaxID=9258 RepID=UPI0019D4D370|nr:uncharacterized protein LOC120638474 [Ornithorhynchus anatinus]
MRGRESSAGAVVMRGVLKPGPSQQVSGQRRRCPGSVRMDPGHASSKGWAHPVGPGELRRAGTARPRPARCVGRALAARKYWSLGMPRCSPVLHCCLSEAGPSAPPPANPTESSPLPRRDRGFFCCVSHYDLYRASTCRYVFIH